MYTANFMGRKLWRKDMPSVYMACDHVFAFLTGSPAEDIVQTYHNNHFLIPHTIWVHCGLSGSSKPDHITLDYYNRGFAAIAFSEGDVVIHDKIKHTKALASHSPDATKISSTDIHLPIRNEKGVTRELCGRSEKFSMYAMKAEQVTCPNCLEEMAAATCGDSKVKN